MAKSIKLTDENYIDASGIKDSTLGMLQSVANARVKYFGNARGGKGIDLSTYQFAIIFITNCYDSSEGSRTSGVYLYDMFSNGITRVAYNNTSGHSDADITVSYNTTSRICYFNSAGWGGVVFLSALAF